MNTISITAGTLKGMYALDYCYTQKTDNDTNDVKVSCDAPVHPDLVGSFQALIPHLALICEEVSKEAVEDFILNGYPEPDPDNPLEIKVKFNVTSFKVTGKGDGEGVVLSGTKMLASGKTINISTPKLKWTDNDDYKFIGELSECIEVCKVEVNEYLNGKHAPDNQLDMFEQKVEAEIVEG